MSLWLYGSAISQANSVYGNSELLSRCPPMPSVPMSTYPNPLSLGVFGSNASLSGLSSQAAALSRASLMSSFFANNSPAAAQAAATSAALSRAWFSRPRSPGQPMVCPLCGLSLDGADVAGHFNEEVHKMETLRKLSDWENSGKSASGLLTTADNSTSPSHNNHHRAMEGEHDQKRRFCDAMGQPCTRWQTYQRVRQNRQTRLSGLLRCNKRYANLPDEKLTLASLNHSSPMSSMNHNSPHGSLNRSSPMSVLNHSSPIGATTLSQQHLGNGAINSGVKSAGKAPSRIWSIVDMSMYNHHGSRASHHGDRLSLEDMQAIASSDEVASVGSAADGHESPRDTARPPTSSSSSSSSSDLLSVRVVD